MFVPDGVLAHVSAVSDEPDLTATKYRITRALGRGGMGVVWAAEDVELGREVAIKVSTVVLAGDFAERLRREARVIARLEHPGIVPVHDVGALPDGRIYYVMKLVRGARLDVWAKEHDAKSALQLFQRVCEAVAFAHARGVIHRDLKPENVMVGEFGEALVMDWGIAKELDDAAARRGGATSAPSDALSDAPPADGGSATMEGTVMGTPAYMPPEQARGDIAALDGRSDVYSLGAILHFLLTRRPPSGIARPLASICAKAMAKSPADRYATALELARDVGRFLDAEQVAAHRESLLELASRIASRHRVLLSLLGVYLLVRVLLIVLAR